MKSVIIYCHPEDFDLKNRLLQMVKSELEKLNHEVCVYSIFGDVYSPQLLNNEEVDLPHNINFDSAISEIQDSIKKCQHLVFVFPKYWDNLSHYLRRFTDEVFLSATGDGKAFATDKKLKFLKATIVTSMRIPQVLFSGRSARGNSNPFTISILKLCGIQNIKWFNISGWSEQNPKLKSKKIEKIRAYFEGLTN